LRFVDEEGKSIFSAIIKGIRRGLSRSGKKTVKHFKKSFLKNYKNIWGKSVNEIVKELEKDGATCVLRQSTKGSKKAIIIEVRGHNKITQIQYHPGGGRHGGSYYKISTSTEGIIKVVDRNTYIPSIGEKAKIIYK